MLPLPLYLYRILDLTASVAGASASRMLADLGAEVIVVERPGGKGDALSQYGRNKFSCVIDPSSEAGRDLVLRTAAGCHVVIKDAGDEALAELDYGSFRGAREDIVLVVVAEGHERPGLGSVAAGAAMTALFHVRFNGEGQQVTVSLPAASASMMTAPIVAASAGASSLTPDLPASGCYACTDGPVALVVRSIDELAALAEVLGRPELADAVTGGEELRETIAAWTAERTAHAASAELRDAGVPAQALLTPEQLRDDPHILARGVFEQVASERGVVQMAGPRLGFSVTPLHTRLPAPAAGEHTGPVLRDIIGLSEDEIESLAAAGVVAGAT